MSALGPGAPTPPIPVAVDATTRATEVVDVSDVVRQELGDACELITDDVALTESGRDWWPLAMTWAVDDQIPARATAIARPTSVEQVQAVARICNMNRVPLTATAGRSGVCGSAIPMHGGVLLDFSALAGIQSIDPTSMVLDVAPGTFGDHLEDELRREHAVTLGHWPQSIALSTVGGWLACRGAGQLSNRYGKIEDMVIGLDVVLADGTLITTGGHARSATGPDLNQLFVGSEGTLGLIVGARFRVHPLPRHTATAAYGFASFAAGLDACREMTQRGAATAVQRLYDQVESDRNFSTGPDHHVLLLLDEGEPALVDARMAVAADVANAATPLDAGIVDQWLGHRNDVSALERLIGGGLVVDTMEITASWAAAPRVYEQALAAIGETGPTLAVSCHQSHAYQDGACLYFTFAGRPEPDEKDDYYRAVWDAGTRAVLAEGGSLSHHHGIGIHRGRYMREALGPAHDTLQTVKSALDPNGILNPGKLGLADTFGSAPW